MWFCKNARAVTEDSMRLDQNTTNAIVEYSNPVPLVSHRKVRLPISGSFVDPQGGSGHLDGTCGVALEATVSLYLRLREQMAKRDLASRTRAEMATTEYLKQIITSSN